MKNDHARARSRFRPICRPSARSAAGIVATSTLILLATAYGGSPSSAASSLRAAGSSSPRSVVAYSHCMRSKGVPNYPDPDSSGQVPKGDAQYFGVTATQYESAQHACRRLLPTAGSVQVQDHQCMQNSDCPQALVQQMLRADLKLARCMRSHGVPNFPDPTTDSGGPIFNITKAGISDAASHTHQFETKLTECWRLAGPNAPESFE